MVDETLLCEPIHTLARMIKGGKLSATALTQACLSRIERLDPKLHAFTTVTTALAMQEAAQADKELEAGLSRGPLHGIPYAVTDLFAVAGCPNSWTTQQHAHQFSGDATAVKILRHAGAVFIGTCATGEIGGGPSHTAITSPCRTPWDLSRSGSSSSGAGASVAAGFVSFALGTGVPDSPMTPASFCGITGLRPTFGRISRAGTMALSWTMDNLGLFCRDARDATTLFSILQGKDPADPSTVAAPFKPALTKAKEHMVGKRIGIVRAYGRSRETKTDQALREAAQLFASMDATIEEITLPEHPYEAVVSTIIAAEAASVFEPLVRSGNVQQLANPALRGALIGGQQISAVDYLRCQRLRSRIAGDFAQLFRRYNSILGSCMLCNAPRVTATSQEIFPADDALTAAESLLGLPAVVLPCGFSNGRLPIGMKIVGRTFGETDVLESAYLYQSLTDWHMRKPDL